GVQFSTRLTDSAATAGRASADQTSADIASARLAVLKPLMAALHFVADGLAVACPYRYQCNKGPAELSTVWLEMPGRRSDSMRRRRDPAATRGKLLKAARREFARSGLAGARVDEIAARAGVNKQLVYHYFGDKDALYLAVLEWVYEEIRTQERKLNLEGLPPERAIRKLIESSFDHLARHPDFILLLNDENRHGA